MQKSIKCRKCNRGFNYDSDFYGDIYCPFCGAFVAERYSYTISDKRLSITFILAFLFGVVGAHRFYVGKYATGVLYLFTGGFFVVGWIFDLLRIITLNFKDRYNHVVRRG